MVVSLGFDALGASLGICKAEHWVIMATTFAPGAFVYIDIYHGGFCPDSVIKDVLAPGIDAVYEVNGYHAHKCEK